jgi:hypothetical protein
MKPLLVLLAGGLLLLAGLFVGDCGPMPVYPGNWHLPQK